MQPPVLLLGRGSLFCFLPHPRHPMKDRLHVRLSWELLMRDPHVGKAILFNRCESMSNRGHRGPPNVLTWEEPLVTFLSLMFSRGHCFEWGNLVKRWFTRSLDFWVFHFSAHVSWSDYIFWIEWQSFQASKDIISVWEALWTSAMCSRLIAKAIPLGKDSYWWFRLKCNG